MKIYSIQNEKKSKEYKDVGTGKVMIPSKTVYTLEVNKDAIDFLTTRGGDTVDSIKYLILHLYNSRRFPLEKTDLFGIIRSSDEEREELIVSLFEMCTSKYKDSSFYILEQVAPLFIDEFNDCLDD